MTGPELIGLSGQRREAEARRWRADWIERQLRALPVVDPDRDASGQSREDAIYALGEDMQARWPGGIAAASEEGRFTLRMLGIKGRGRDFASACADWALAARASLPQEQPANV